MGLALTLKYGEQVQIGDAVVFLEKDIYNETMVRIHIEAPRTMPIIRLKTKSEKQTSYKIKKEKQNGTKQSA